MKQKKSLEKGGYFRGINFKINIDVNNDVETFEYTEKLLGKYKESFEESYEDSKGNKQKRKVENSGNQVNNVQKDWFDLGLAKEIEVTGEMGAISRGQENQNDYNNLRTIEEAINENSQERQDILKSERSGKEKNKALKTNQKNLKNLEQAKMDIVSPYLNKIETQKRFSAYKKITKTVEELSEMMKFDTKINEYSTLEQTKIWWTVETSIPKERDG